MEETGFFLNNEGVTANETENAFLSTRSNGL